LFLIGVFSCLLYSNRLQVPTAGLLFRPIPIPFSVPIFQPSAPSHHHFCLLASSCRRSLGFGFSSLLCPVLSRLLWLIFLALPRLVSSSLACLLLGFASSYRVFFGLSSWLCLVLFRLLWLVWLWHVGPLKVERDRYPWGPTTPTTNNNEKYQHFC
jgi:hypothetical protein